MEIPSYGMHIHTYLQKLCLRIINNFAYICIHTMELDCLLDYVINPVVTVVLEYIDCLIQIHA